MKQKEKKEIVRHEKNAGEKHIDKNHKIFSANNVRLDINPEKARIVFTDESLTGFSSFEIETTRKDWLLILEELTAKTLVFLIQHSDKDTEKILRQNPTYEMMFR